MGSTWPACGHASAQWVLDTLDADFGDHWLRYQAEIGRRHTDGKNQTDGVSGAPEIVPFRYLAALTYPIYATMRPFLAPGARDEAHLERMHQAWLKAVILSVCCGRSRTFAPTGSRRPVSARTRHLEPNTECGRLPHQATQTPGLQQHARLPERANLVWRQPRLDEDVLRVVAERRGRASGAQRSALHLERGRCLHLTGAKELVL